MASPMSRMPRSRSRRAPATAGGEAMRGALVLTLSLVAGCAATKSEAPDGGNAITGTGTGGGGSSGGGGHAGGLVLPQIPDTGYTALPGDVGGYLRGTEIQAADIQLT